MKRVPLQPTSGLPTEHYEVFMRVGVYTVYDRLKIVYVVGFGADLKQCDIVSYI
jgi:hypothetical protein